MRNILIVLASLFVLVACNKQDEPSGGGGMGGDPMDPPPVVFKDTLRFASYNISLYANNEGQILQDLENASQFIRLIRLATVIQNVAPDVLVLMEVDFDAEGRVVDLFRKNLLEVKLTEAEPITYEYAYQIDSNTGLISGVDIDGNGSVSLPNDAFGFGEYPGKYASAILSKYPLDLGSIRSFQEFLWKDMMNAELPVNSDGSNYYPDEVLEVFRLSSKNHVDIPIVLPDSSVVHALISHPTPPVFDGAEDRNGKRNHDEIKLWADYLSDMDYLIDDDGIEGGLSSEASFILFGDQNADPFDGDSYNFAANQLLNHPRVNSRVANGNLIPASNGGSENNENTGDIGDPSNDTSFFGLRVDYVLPSDDLNVIASGVYWPASNEPGHEVIQDGSASDHLLVWVDIRF